MAAKPRKSATPKVDETVENQEAPFSKVTERPSTEENQAPEVPKMAPANEVDETVVNQESPGTHEAVNRNPEPMIVEDSAGIKYDLNKTPQPELVQEDREAEKNRIRQTEGALNAADWREEDKEDDRKFVEVEFLESGFTVARRVWKKGEVLREIDDENFRKDNEDGDGSFWFDQSADDQRKRYGKVFFEKR
jgi:hypothetical protein